MCRRAFRYATFASPDIDATVASDIAHVPNAVNLLRPNGRAIFVIPNRDHIATEDRMVRA